MNNYAALVYSMSNPFLQTFDETNKLPFIIKKVRRHKPITFVHLLSYIVVLFFVHLIQPLMVFPVVVFITIAYYLKNKPAKASNFNN